MQTASKQQGSGLILWLFALIVIAATIALAVKLAPIYVENYMVKRVLDSVREEAPTIKAESSGDINRDTREFILRRLAVHNIRHVTNDNISINNAAAHVNARVFYEVRVPIMANVDAILRFDNSVQVAN